MASDPTSLVFHLISIGQIYERDLLLIGGIRHYADVCCDILFTQPSNEGSYHKFVSQCLLDFGNYFQRFPYRLRKSLRFILHFSHFPFLYICLFSFLFNSTVLDTLNRPDDRRPLITFLQNPHFIKKYVYKRLPNKY